jgi:hypothetical protein
LCASSTLSEVFLEYANCVWNLFYDVRVDRVERVQKRFIRYALRGLGWTDMHDLPPSEDRCALLHLDTLALNLLSVFDLITPRYPTRGTEFLCIDFHRTNNGLHESISGAMRQFNEVIGLFDFGLTRDQFLNRLRLNL